MGHRHHRKGCGSCGGNGCGGCGWGGGGGLWPAAALAQQQLVAAAAPWGVPPYGGIPYGGMQPAMADVAAANGMIVQTPVTSMQGYPSFGQAPMAPYTTPAQVLATYGQMSAQAGFPIIPLAMPFGFKSKKIRKKKTRTVVLHTDTVITGDVVYLHIPYRVAKHFDICSLRIGRHYLIGTGSKYGASADLYSVPGGVAIPLPGGILLPGQSVYLKVRNHDCKRSHTFRADLVGAAL